MSSESDNHHDNDMSPRKRRRLGSLNHTHAHAEGRRRQHVLRRRQVEAKYNDGYRTLFNDHVTWVTSHLDDSESAQHYSTQIGSTLWSSTEQARFFGALARLGKDDLPGIAKAIQTKTAIETRDLLVLLQDAAAKQGDAKLTLRDIPAATDVGHECGQQLDDAADALAWYQETLEASQEQERYGEHWLITPSIADDIERAMNGVTQSCEPTPDVFDLEPKRHGNGITVYVSPALLYTCFPSSY
jgi:RNA polymerase I-specific transcription initiation factor RRN5